jgi:hypothetical protein
MRASMLALAGILICAATAAPAQTVIDVESQKAAEPPVENLPQTQPQMQPQPAPTEAPTQPKEPVPATAPPGGRFTFNRIDNGYLRLDTQSGEVAYCRTQTTGWACQAVPESRVEMESNVARLQADVTALKDLKSEIAQLRDEVASLKREVAGLKEPPPPRPPADVTPPAKGGEAIIKLPTHEDIARARDFIEKAWHRLVEMINAVQKDVMQKG